MKALFFTLLCCFSFTQILGQDPINDPFTIPEFVPISPEVASFQRYGEIPVSLYTGVPNISIPIHTVTKKDLQVPISLTYHAGGITVNQEATYVGLGWTLFAGGTITISQKGKRELNIFNTSNWEETLAYYASLNPPDIISTGNEGAGHSYSCGLIGDPPTDFLVITNAASGYGEQDVYSVSLPNRSFKFIVHPKTGKPFFVGEKNKCVIEVISQWYFKIIDENGVTYLFEEYEEGGDPVSPNCWYLTSMTDMNGNTIEFNYDSFGGILEQGSGFHEVLKFGYPAVNPIRFEGSGSANVNNLYLTSIRTNLEEVVFNYSHDRDDIYGNGAMRLNSIEVQNIITNNGIKKYLFNYGYFSASTVGGNYATDTDEVPSTPSDFLKKRLKLEKIIVENPNDNTDSHSYDFSYYEDYQLPLKTTFAKDFWGYYNGQENASQLYENIRHTLIPNPRILAYMQNDYVDFVETHPDFEFDECANRFSHPDYIKTATIKSITYPTGGRTEFEFEPHDFYNEELISAEDYPAFEKVTSAIAGVSDMNDPYGYSVTSVPFTLTDSRTVKLKGGINKASFPSYDLRICTIGIVSTSGGGSYIYNFQSQDYWEVDIDLVPGDYRLVCSAPENIPFNNYSVIVYADLFNSYFDEDAINEALSKVSIGGGLRVKKVSSYGSDNNLISTKEYIYKKENGTTSGKLIRYPYNYKEERLVHIIGDAQNNFRRDLTIKSLLSDNILPIYNSSNAPNVAYDRVVTKQISNVGNNDNGSEVYYYTNEEPMLGVDFNFYNRYTNGDVEKKIILNESNDTLRVEDYNYDFFDYEKAMVNITAKDRFYGSNSICLYDYFSTGGRYDVVAYANTNYVNYLESVETKDYLDIGIVATLTENLYDINTYQIKELKIHTDKGLRKTTYQYPTDNPDYLSHSVMLTKNWVNPIIEQKHYLDNDLLKTTKNHYWFYNNNATIALHDINIGFGNNTPETKVVFDNYDLKGNVLDLHKSDDISSTFLWGYGGEYPVAKIENASFSEVESAVSNISSSFIASLGQSNSQSYINTKLSQLRTEVLNDLPNAQITTYTYDPLVGMTSQTDPAGVTIYYEYDDFGRLKNVKDSDGKILNHTEYHYAE